MIAAIKREQQATGLVMFRSRSPSPNNKVHKTRSAQQSIDNLLGYKIQGGQGLHQKLGSSCLSELGGTACGAGRPDPRLRRSARHATRKNIAHHHHSSVPPHHQRVQNDTVQHTLSDCEHAHVPATATNAPMDVRRADEARTWRRSSARGRGTFPAPAKRLLRALTVASPRDRHCM